MILFVKDGHTQAKIAGLYPQKGTIQIGSDADLILIDPKKEWTITTEKMHGNADYTCNEGTKVTGVIEKVFLCGSEIVADGSFVGTRGEGRYLTLYPKKEVSAVLCPIFASLSFEVSKCSRSSLTDSSNKFSFSCTLG